MTSNITADSNVIALSMFLKSDDQIVTLNNLFTHRNTARTFSIAGVYPGYFKGLPNMNVLLEYFRLLY